MLCFNLNSLLHKGLILLIQSRLTNAEIQSTVATFTFSTVIMLTFSYFSSSFKSYGQTTPTTTKMRLLASVTLKVLTIVRYGSYTSELIQYSKPANVKLQISIYTDLDRQLFMRTKQLTRTGRNGLRFLASHHINHKDQKRGRAKASV